MKSIILFFNLFFMAAIQGHENARERPSHEALVLKESANSAATLLSMISRMRQNIVHAIKTSIQRRKELTLQREFIHSQEFIEINRMLAYDRREDSIILHVAPSKTLSLSEKLRFLRDGFEKIADLLISDSSIQHIRGSSWIVAKHPSLFRRMGFQIQDPQAVQKSKDGQPYKKASMNRDDFLNRYSPRSQASD